MGECDTAYALHRDVVATVAIVAILKWLWYRDRRLLLDEIEDNRLVVKSLRAPFPGRRATSNDAKRLALGKAVLVPQIIFGPNFCDSEEPAIFAVEGIKSLIHLEMVFGMQKAETRASSCENARMNEDGLHCLVFMYFAYAVQRCLSRPSSATPEVARTSCMLYSSRQRYHTPASTRKQFDVARLDMST